MFTIPFILHLLNKGTDYLKQEMCRHCLHDLKKFLNTLDSAKLWKSKEIFKRLWIFEKENMFVLQLCMIKDFIFLKLTWNLKFLFCLLRFCFCFCLGATPLCSGVNPGSANGIIIWDTREPTQLTLYKASAPPTTVLLFSSLCTKYYWGNTRSSQMG